MVRELALEYFSDPIRIIPVLSYLLFFIFFIQTKVSKILSFKKELLQELKDKNTEAERMVSRINQVMVRLSTGYGLAIN